MSEYLHKRHNVTVLIYHLVFPAKYRRAATAGSSPGMSLIQLAPMVDRIVRTVASAYRAKQPAVAIVVGRNLYLRIDEGDLMELLGNLIDNAFKWCCHHIQIAASYQGDQVLIKIEDDGPGIPPHEIAHILERGARADQSTSGHGIGLAIDA